MLKDFAISIVLTLREQDHEAYLVGGCVRDLLLGREPADYDVATSATPNDVANIFYASYAVGAQFGVMLIPAPKDQASGSANSVVEVSTFRADIGYTDGRHPDQVRFCLKPTEDVKRRDFTINGMMLDVTPKGRLPDPILSGLLDFVGGRKDLEAKIVRTIGDPEQRFAEDKLRMLRAVRFAARFGFEIEQGTLGAIRKLSPGLGRVSAERVRDELTKMLTEGQARRAFELLGQTGLLHEVLPEIEAMKGIEQPPQFHPEGDVFVHTLLLLEKLPHPCELTLAWGALLHDVGKPPTFRVAPDRIRFDGHVEIGVAMARAICQRLRFSNDQTEQILALVENHMRFADVQKMKESTFKRFVRIPDFEEHLELHRLDCLSSHADLTLYDFTRRKMNEMPPDVMRPKPLITGETLIASGYKPGPRFKEILSSVEDGQLEGRLQTDIEALEFVKKKFPREI